MIKGILNWKLRAEIDRMEVVYWLIAFFTMMAHLSALRSMGFFSIIVLTALWIGVFRFLYISFERLYYTLWTLLAFITLLEVVIYFPINSHSLFGPFFFASLALVNIAIFAYLMFTPVYYPIVSWWEYDFRFRDEVKVQIKKGEHKFEGRLSDVRRKAACLQTFDELGIGELVELALPFERAFEVEIMSKRRPNLGRPTIYGVRFILKDSNNRDFDNFCREWKTEKIVKSKIKRNL